MSLTSSSSTPRIAGASGVLLLLALALDTSGLAWSQTARNLALVVASVAAGAPIALRAGQALRARAFSIDLLVTIAVVGALIIGEYVEAAVVSFLFVFGAYLEARTLERTRRSLRELIDLAPKEAEVVRDGTSVTISVDDVEVGDRVLVRTGGRVPVDGTVVHGAASVDEAAITGEPLPVTKEIDDPLWSGTVLADGYVEMRANRVGEDTTFAQIVELVEEAQDSKARTQRFLDRFASWYTPAIIAAAMVALVWTRDVRFALTFLVIACPGALVISTPVSLVAGLGNAARHGALVKGGDALERLARFDTLVMDKTGTLTSGRPEVTELVAVTGTTDESEVLRLAASLEQASEHPLGRTIVAAASARGLRLAAAPAGVEVVKGAGIRGLVEAAGRVRAVAVGSHRLLTEMGYAVPPAVGQRAAELERLGNTVAFVLVDDSLVGVLAIADRVRLEAAEAIASLRRTGVERFVILTGDNPHTAAAVAAQVGIDGEHDEVHARLLPQDKVSQVRRLTALGHHVAMIGDGVNDAPAIATADIGLAMGGGTDVSLETADVILVGNRFDQLLQARSVGRATLWNMAQNTTVALGTVALLLAGVVGGVVHMAGGMLVHEVSVLVVILNAMRLIRHRDQDAARIGRSGATSSAPRPTATAVEPLELSPPRTAP